MGKEVEFTEAFVTMAQIALGLAGFTGIIASLERREGNHPWDLWRMKSLVLTMFGALPLSLLPFVVASLGAGTSCLWRTCSAVAMAYLLTVSGIAILAPDYGPPDVGTVPFVRPASNVVWTPSVDTPIR